MPVSKITAVQARSPRTLNIVFFISEYYRPSGRDTYGQVISLYPYIDGAWVINRSAVCREFKCSESIEIIYDLYIGGVPYVIITADSFAKLFHSCPVLFRVKLVAVPPYVKEAHKAVKHRGCKAFPKLFCKAFVMAGSVPTHKIRGDAEIHSLSRSTGILHSLGAAGVYDALIVIGKGIGHSANGVFAFFFKKYAVFSYLSSDILIGSIVEKGVSRSVAGYFVSAVKLFVGIRINEFGIFQKVLEVFLKARVAEMEGSLEAVFIEKLDKADIFYPAVIVAEGNAPFASALPEGGFYKFHILLRFCIISIPVVCYYKYISIMRP